MQANHKRILSSLITTLLIISILAFPPSFATALYDSLIDTISPTEGPIGVSVTVSGEAPEAISEDYPVKIYWSTEAQLPSEAGYGYGYGIQYTKLLATVTSPKTEGGEDYEVSVTIPHVPPEGGVYYIVAWQDENNDTYVDDGEWDYAEFTVKEGIYPESGNVGDEVVIGGWTETPGGLVEVYWEDQSPENKLGETYAKADTSFSLTVTVPDPPAGEYTFIVVDKATGDLAIPTTKTAFTLEPEITISPTTALPGDTISVEGTGFAAESEITLTMDGTSLTTDPETVETDVNGSFSCTFKVPSDTEYDTYTVTATDEDGNSDGATLKVGAIITLSPDEGPSGTIVTITGEGWDDVDPGTEVTVLVQNTNLNMTCPVVDTIKIKSDGTFEGEFIVPTLDVDTYTINATAGGVSGTADFDVTGTTDITLSPTSGAPESTVTIEGVNFTALAGVEITIDFGPIEEAATATTNSTGGFLTTVTVPPLTPRTEVYYVNATDENGLNATATFRVSLTTLAVSPSSGPTGTKVLVVGGGLTPGADFNVTINGELMVDGTGTLDSDGNIPDNTYVYVPTVSPGKYTITVMDEEGVMATASFEVTKTTEIVLTPSSAPQGYNVTIELNYFTAAEGTDIDLTIYNVTAEGDIYWERDLWTFASIEAAEDFTVGETDEDGSFEGTFIVPDSLALGDYYINATDANGLNASVTFSVVKPTVIVYTGSDTYMPGDSVAFFAKCTFDYADQVINLYTPENFKIEITDLDILTKLGNYYTGTVSYILPSDAKLGTWFWNTTIGEETVNGTFTVIEKPTMAALSVEVSRLKEDVASLAATVESLSETVTAQAEDIDKLSKAVSDLQSAVSDLSTALSGLQGDVSNVATAVSSAQTAAEDASKAATAAQSAVAGVQTAVYGAVILSLIAAVAAIMSIVIMQRKIAG